MNMGGKDGIMYSVVGIMIHIVSKMIFDFKTIFTVVKML